ncbi:hypothetical protein C9994_08585 [Marivirga lumbricoides]|uniref:Uncharacterized protein n=1 Tax=Marivirga lumbricoides TaxID=1046115 RepID=A0A2T4DQR4_9BACT|nr:hypothetical protein C9994_08585 [Marivirga lumbricoides]
MKPHSPFFYRIMELLKHSLLAELFGVGFLKILMCTLQQLTMLCIVEKIPDIFLVPRKILE